MIADVPVGAFLSGGIDSGTVVALSSSMSKHKLKTFSLGFDDPDFDESKYAEQISKIYKTEHYSLKADTEVLKNPLLESYQHFDEPFADNSLIPTLLLCKMTSKKVKVALSGDGGDENFGGYERYTALALGNYYKKVPPLVRSFLKLPARTHPAARVFANTLDLPFSQKYLHYKPFSVKNIAGRQVQTYDKKLNDLENAFKYDISSYLPEDLLYKVDIASMAYSLEVRAPFLNHELLRLTAQMPSNLKVKNFQTKYIFKKILKEKKILPESIINRKKRGFVSPVGKLLKTEENGIVREVLLQKKYLNLFVNRNEGSLFSHVSLSLWAEKYL